MITKKVAELMSQGMHIFSPLNHSHDMATRFLSDWTQFKYWREYDLSMLERCDAMIVYKLQGWNKSIEIRTEREFAQRRGKPLFFLEPS